MSAEGFEKDLIYDVGLHKGEDSELYLKKGFRVVAVEALPLLANMATDRLRKYVDSHQLVILTVAIAEKDGPLSFYENSGSSVWGTLDPDMAQQHQRPGQTPIKRTVEGMNFGNILRQHGMPYYLKIDIEGSDILCLEALKAFASKPKHLSFESTRTSWKGLRQEFALLKTLGYSRFKVVPQQEVAAQVCPVPAREGQYANHHFENGASGLFGEEAPGEWIDEAEALRIYRSIFVQYKLWDDNRLINKFRVIFRQRSALESGSSQEPQNTVQRYALAKRFIQSFVPHKGWYDTHATA